MALKMIGTSTLSLSDGRQYAFANVGGYAAACMFFFLVEFCLNGLLLLHSLEWFIGVHSE